MLPWLKTKEASASAPADKMERRPDEDAEPDYLKECAKELIAAVHAKDESGVAMALKAAFDICDSEPHEEGPHVS